VPEASVTAVAGAWAVLALPAVLLLGVGAAALQARGDGVPRPASAPVAGSARLLRQRRRATVDADSLLWRVAVLGLPVTAALMVVVVPFGRWTPADLDVGVVWFNAMDVVVWALVWLAGWGPNSTFGLVGGYRFLGLALGYELPLMFALTAPAVGAQSLRMADVVAAQQGLWFVVWMPLAFAVYCLGVVAFSVSGPFRAPAGPDLAGGVLAEASGVDRLLVLAGRYALLAAGAAFAVPAFLGGGLGPVLPAWLWSVLKTALLLAGLVWLRRRVPVLRPDRFAEAAWTLLLPLTLLQLLVVSVIVVVRS
jgi:NADH-quinone oxidoreductase subunit H